MRRRKLFLALAAILVTGISLLLYHVSSSPGLVATEKQPVTLKIAAEDYGYPSPYTFYPRGPGYIRMSLLFDTLVWKDQKGVIPWLSERYEVSKDGREWVFYLHPGVKWHDGQPLTAEDVKFTFEYIRSHPHPWYSREINIIESIEAINAQQVRLTLKTPYAPFLTNIAATIPIIPKHIWQTVSDPMKFTDPTAVIGSGPFKLVKYDKAASLYIYEANPQYFKGRVKIGRLVFTWPGQPLLAFQNGEVDAFNPDADQVAVLKGGKNVKIIEGSGFWIFRLMFNLAQHPFDQLEFRQAVAYALNLPEIVSRATHGGATPGNPGYLSPELGEWYNPRVATYPYDPEKARNLLTGLGYTQIGPDGIRRAPDGKRLSFELLTFQQGQDGEIVKNMLAAVGIDVRIKAMEKGAHDQLIDSGQYQMALNGHGGIGGDPVFLNQLIKPLTAVKDNPTLYNNPEYIRLARQQTAMIDKNERRQAVFKMQEILANDLPTIPLYYRKMYFAYRPDKLDGWFYTPGGIAIGIPTEFNKLVFIEPR
ncbi:extracellular solute-binding protein, family 5 [Thermosinus carboxydivorans Nor1]|uniref:Extracellular solute-binding protein, family 5 n=1 Tax=Thermosinus carboxydivorans Nor1 TaxID=401526 RepID=A1HNQ5_9FIRM|nr:ABC transporter substrate-binding protein [Thermosinus carboxydivorans]EAX48408.1 extracellular solute-binding protein, family 5 [Thermosinus carboxydivorans Nor1]